MSALDIGARGIAQRARLDFERTTERNASLAMRSEPTAAALEALAAEHSLLTGEPGAVYTVEEAPFVRRQRLIIRGNGAELRNVNQTPLNVDHNISAALPLGVSTVWDTSYLTYYPVASASGRELALASGAGANFAPGDLVVLHGATKYYGPGNAYEVYRNYLRARVLDVSADLVVIDRALPAQLLADSPVIGNTAEDMPTAVTAAGTHYLLYAPHISNLQIASDVGDAFQHGGVIDGVFRDLTLEGRNGLVLNALQDCLFENIRIRAWRKICELAEGSYGTVVRGMRGTLTDASTRFGGASDASSFYIALGENCAECVLEEFAVDSGPNDPPDGSAVVIGSGRNNEIRNSRLRFPAVTGRILSVQPNPALGHPIIDCGFRNLTVTAPVCSQFLACNDAGSGLVRPYLVDSRFYGVPTMRAATLGGQDGQLRGNFFENGDVYLFAAATGWRVEGNTINGSMVFQGGTNNVVRGNYVRDGFQGLTDSVLKLNTVADNESDASRRLDAASLISDTQASITTTTPNTASGTATFAAGDLSPGDKIYFSSFANTSSAGTTSRFARVSLTQNSTTTGLGSHSVATPTTPIGIEGVVEIRSDTLVVCNFSIGEKQVHATVPIASVTANGLTLNLEYWVSAADEQINLRAARIVAVKPGMKHLPIN
jgi:hypothetical protein